MFLLLLFLEVLLEEAVSDKGKTPEHIINVRGLCNMYIRLEFNIIRGREVHTVHGKTFCLCNVDQSFS